MIMESKILITVKTEIKNRHALERVIHEEIFDWLEFKLKEGDEIEGTIIAKIKSENKGKDLENIKYLADLGDVEITIEEQKQP
jgi:hypothetical protein